MDGAAGTATLSNLRSRRTASERFLEGQQAVAEMEPTEWQASWRATTLKWAVTAAISTIWTWGAQLVGGHVRQTDMPDEALLAQVRERRLNHRALRVQRVTSKLEQNWNIQNMSAYKLLYLKQIYIAKRVGREPTSSFTGPAKAGATRGNKSEAAKRLSRHWSVRDALSLPSPRA
jgi:hypothetical protein